MSKLSASIAPALLACVLALACFLICARIFHMPPIAMKVASIVIMGTTSLALIGGGVASLFRSKAD